MDFYYSPKTCSQATHILLHEAGLPFRPRKVDIFAGQVEEMGDYAEVNPNGYVPALVFDDGTLLTENVAILDWVASQGTELIPPGEMGRTRHLQMLAFVSTELQKPFVRLFFSESEEEKAHLAETLAKRFRWIASRMEGDYIFGNQFTASDAFVYVMIRWAAMVKIDLPENLHELARRVEGRESTRAVLAREEAEPLRGAA